MTTAPATKKSFFNRPAKPYVNPYLGGAILGIVLFPGAKRARASGDAGP